MVLKYRTTLPDGREVGRSEEATPFKVSDLIPGWQEALQYMAVTLSEEDWDIDGVRDLEAGMPRVRQQLRSGETWELDVLEGHLDDGDLAASVKAKQAVLDSLAVIGRAAHVDAPEFKARVASARGMRLVRRKLRSSCWATRPSRERRPP